MIELDVDVPNSCKDCRFLFDLYNKYYCGLDRFMYFGDNKDCICKDCRAFGCPIDRFSKKDR